MKRWLGLFALPAAALAFLACGDGAGPAPDPALRDTVVTPVATVSASYTGSTLILSPLVRVTDGAGRPLAGVPVSYEVTAGGGRVLDADARTNADGHVHVRGWLLGAEPGTNTMRVVVASRVATFDVVATVRPLQPWEWRPLGAPLGDRTVSNLVIDSEDDGRWYATSFQNGLYVTTDTGRSWRRTLAGSTLNDDGFAIDPSDPRRLFAALGRTLWLSTDRGETWTVSASFPQLIRSIEVGRGDSIWAAPQWGAAEVPGVYLSVDGGSTFALRAFGVAQGTQLLTWTLFRNPRTGSLFAGNEIANHPQPYRPPVLRSRDGGLTWEDVTGTLPWHVTHFAFDSASGRLYAITEGAGLAYSMDDGATWTLPTNVNRFGSAALADPSHADRLYVAHFSREIWPGGVYAVPSPGAAPVGLGLVGSSVTSLALNRDRTRMYATVYDGGTRPAGIYVALVGELP